MTGVYEVPLAPLRGDGRLTVRDVECALDGLPHDAGDLSVLIDETDDFEPGAPEWLARVLAGRVVSHRFGSRAWRVGADWLACFDRAAAHFLAVEARLLDRGA